MRVIKIFSVICLMLCLVSCGQKGEKEKKVELSERSLQQVVSKTDTTPGPTQVSEEEKTKTVEEVLDPVLFGDTPEEYQKKYDAPEMEKVRHNDINEWKDAKGNYHAPKGYKILLLPAHLFAEEMAAQQMPQELLDEISTEELYQLIMSLPTKNSGFATYRDHYLISVADWYLAYNFMTDFIRREDSSQVVHQYYQKYSEEDKLDYTGSTYVKKRKIIDYTDKEEYQKQQQFQLTEALEWFFQYKEGDSIPEEEWGALGVDAYEHNES